MKVTNLDNETESTPVTSKYRRKVFQYTVKGFFFKEWDSVKDAADGVRASKQSVYNVLQGKTRTSKNYQFSYEKVDQMPALEYNCNVPIGIDKMAKKEALNIEYIDFGVITDPNHREFGLRKIRIESKKVDIYTNPSKPVEQIINRIYNL